MLSLKLSSKEVIVIKCDCCDNELAIKPYKKNGNGNIVPVPANISLKFKGEGFNVGRKRIKDEQ